MHACMQMQVDACLNLLMYMYIYICVYVCIYLYSECEPARFVCCSLFALGREGGEKGETRRLFLFPRMNRTERVRTAQRVHTNIYEACTPTYDLPREIQIRRPPKRRACGIAQA